VFALLIVQLSNPVHLSAIANVLLLHARQDFILVGGGEASPASAAEIIASAMKCAAMIARSAGNRGRNQW
jgi:hypothetical protein